jgi:uncharacterized membrane protein YfcA
LGSSQVALEDINITFLIIGMALTGVVGGVIAGLLGVGGGIVIVPVLDATLQIIGVDAAVRMHVAVATSLSTIIPTSISSSRAHNKKGAVDFALIKSWSIPVFLGAVAGTAAATVVQTKVLSAVFAFTALLVAVKMVLPLERLTFSKSVPTGVAGAPIPVLIGGISSMMGIGGGTLSVPILSLFDYPIHRAVGTAALFGLIISVPGTIGMMIGGWHEPGLPPGSIGYVNMIGFALIAPTSWVAAPWGARLAHGLNKRHLSIAFGIFLLIVGLRMAYRVFAT